MNNRTTDKSTKSKKVERRIISIDITDIYERLKKKSEEEIRSVEEQCKFFIKKGLDEICSSPTTITYIQQPAWRDNWDRNTTPSRPSYPTYPSYPYVWCGTDVNSYATATAETSNSNTKAEFAAKCEDVSLNAKTGMYETKV